MSGRCVVAKVRGSMDYGSQSWFRRRLTQLINDSDRPVVLELTQMSFCDSAGLNMLLDARRQSEDNGLNMVLACVPYPLRRMLVMTGADQVLRVYDTVEDAESAI